jgi:hypothetical protein
MLTSVHRFVTVRDLPEHDWGRSPENRDGQR